MEQAERAQRAAVERAAARQARERRLRLVRPGWWVYSVGETGGDWAEVVSSTTYRDPDDGGPRVRLVLRDLNSRRVLVENHPTYPAWCCTDREAHRIGLGAQR